MPEKKYIRFIDSDYQTLFHLPDGGRMKAASLMLAASFSGAII